MEKFDFLKKKIKDMNRVIVAFSGGVDSTFLLKVACDVLGKDNVLAVTAKSGIRFDRGFEKSRRLIDMIGAKHIVIKTKELEDNNFVQNDKLRCYYCKLELFGQIKKIAAENEIEYILDGTNYDDITGDYRPGLDALTKFEIRSPLEEVKLTKQEIRDLSKKLSLPTWNHPSDTCLATRFNYGIEIDKQLLEKLSEVESFLHDFNFKQLRARLHDLDTIRIEVLPEEIEKVVENREKIYSKIKKIGFNYITLDLQGYRSGSMNEILEGEKDNA